MTFEPATRRPCRYPTVAQPRAQLAAVGTDATQCEASRCQVRPVVVHQGSRHRGESISETVARLTRCMRPFHVHVPLHEVEPGRPLICHEHRFRQPGCHVEQLAATSGLAQIRQEVSRQVPLVRRVRERGRPATTQRTSYEVTRRDRCGAHPRTGRWWSLSCHLLAQRAQPRRQVTSPDAQLVVRQLDAARRAAEFAPAEERPTRNPAEFFKNLIDCQ